MTKERERDPLGTLKIDLTVDLEPAIAGLTASLERLGGVRATCAALLITSPLSGASSLLLRYSTAADPATTELDDFEEFEFAGSLTDHWIGSDVEVVEVRLDDEDVRRVDVSEEALSAPYLDFLASVVEDSTVKSLWLDLVHSDEVALQLFFDHDGDIKRQFKLSRR